MYKQRLHLVCMASNLPKIRKGFTLMFAMMVLGITSVVALTLASVVTKSLASSREADDALLAFYAAESANEENLYRHAQGLACSTTGPVPVFTNGASFVRTCESTAACSQLTRATGSFRGAHLALQVCLP